MAGEQTLGPLCLALTGRKRERFSEPRVLSLGAFETR